jgi:mono/diheme cytochrome c family protein
MTAMRSGQRPDGTVMLPFMPWPSYSRWTEDDLKAAWLYLRTLPKADHKVPPSTLTGIAVNAEGAARGGGLFDVYCRTCHGEKGAGAPFTHVALKDVARGLDQATLSGFINKGLPGTAMPGFGKTLTNEQMTDLVTFIRSW